ncbi:MAG: type II toxin-antitoxin system RatA family toxin [Alphaproteobacteria bacterium]|nr:type II toxin-antitoxin system RatA family toxin [Alphaproteobacteria bacterium]
MPHYHEKRILPYTPSQLYDIVADVEKYQEFLPWCVGTRINWRKADSFNADVLIGYQAIRETFTSTVTLTPNEAVEVRYEHGPFSKLKNYWTFAEHKDGCEVEFFIDFEFRAGLLNAIISSFFEEAVKRMIGAFEKRAEAIYS